MQQDNFTQEYLEKYGYHIPQYIKIKSYLRELIANLEPNSAIPGESELAKLFQVSRGTAKQAIMDLVYEGLLYRKQGKGTFVSSHILRSYESLPTFTDDIERSGKKCHSKSLKLSQSAPAPRARAFFGLEKEENVIRYKRLVLADTTPVAIVISYLNCRLYKGITLADIGDSLYDTLKEKFNAVPVRSHDTYTIASISPHTASLLQCSTHEVVCYSERLAYLADDTPAEFVESYIRSDFFKLEIDYNSMK